MEQMGFGYRTLAKAVYTSLSDTDVDVDALDRLNWEDVRDVVKKGRRLGDSKLNVLVRYLRLVDKSSFSYIGIRSKILKLGNLLLIIIRF